MALTLASMLPLRRGAQIPIFGLGTWLSNGAEGTGAVKAALDYGYKLIDTATMYKNESEVGAALAAHKGDAPFLVTKLEPCDHGRDRTLAALDASMAKLKAPIDLWLMHSPSGKKVVETWRTMLEARDAGRVRSVGVSNFGEAQLRALAATGLEAPEVNQVELHVFNQQRGLVQYCQQEGIRLMAFCPLCRCKLFGQTPLAELAKAAGRSEAEMMIRWLLQKGLVVIPKSSSPARIASNAAFGFELSEEQMASMEALERGFAASNACGAQQLDWEGVK